ncbi:hypothetical protein JOH51_002642 [Rhizobium leguminosarum]|nr:hypothetical protein [Rhizobium leguminosarum]
MTTRQLTLAITWSCIFLCIVLGYQLSGVSLRGMERRYVHERHCFAGHLCHSESRDLWLTDALEKAQARKIGD